MQAVFIPLVNQGLEIVLQFFHFLTKQGRKILKFVFKDLLKETSASTSIKISFQFLCLNSN
jgi:hypothetical protein